MSSNAFASILKHMKRPTAIIVSLPRRQLFYCEQLRAPQRATNKIQLPRRVEILCFLPRTTILLHAMPKVKSQIRKDSRLFVLKYGQKRVLVQRPKSYEVSAVSSSRARWLRRPLSWQLMLHASISHASHEFLSFCRPKT